MTTARDVILTALEAKGRELGWPTGNIWSMAADASLSALLSAPESVRLELVAKLNPWRDIKTAPKDGDTNILIGCFGEHSHGEQFVVFHDESSVAGFDYVWQTADGIAYHRDLPTHWLPLLAPPSEDRA